MINLAANIVEDIDPPLLPSAGALDFCVNAMFMHANPLPMDGHLRHQELADNPELLPRRNLLALHREFYLLRIHFQCGLSTPDRSTDMSDVA